MKNTDDSDISKLIEQGRLNREILNKLQSTLTDIDGNLFQSIKEKLEEKPGSNSSSEVEETNTIIINEDLSDSPDDTVEKSVKRKMPNLTIDLSNETGEEDDNVQPAQSVNPRNVILNKWAKEAHTSTGTTLVSPNKQHHSSMRVLDMQIIRPQQVKQPQQDIQNQQQILQSPPILEASTASPTMAIMPSINNQVQQNATAHETAQSPSNTLRSSNVEMFNQLQAAQNMRSNVIQRRNSSPYPSDSEQQQQQQQQHQQSIRRICCHPCCCNSFSENTGPSRQTQNNNYQPFQNQQQFFGDCNLPTMNQPMIMPNNLLETSVERPIPLVKRVTQTSQTYQQRPRPFFNPSPGNEYNSPHIYPQYQPLRFGQVPFFPGPNLPQPVPMVAPIRERNPISQIQAAADKYFSQTQEDNDNKVKRLKQQHYKQLRDMQQQHYQQQRAQMQLQQNDPSHQHLQQISLHQSQEGQQSQYFQMQAQQEQARQHQHRQMQEKQHQMLLQQQLNLQALQAPQQSIQRQPPPPTGPHARFSQSYQPTPLGAMPIDSQPSGNNRHSLRYMNNDPAASPNVQPFSILPPPPPPPMPGFSSRDPRMSRRKSQEQKQRNYPKPTRNDYRPPVGAQVAATPVTYMAQNDNNHMWPLGHLGERGQNPALPSGSLVTYRRPGYTPNNPDAPAPARTNAWARSPMSPSYEN